MNTIFNDEVIYKFWFKNLDNGAELYPRCLILRDVREFVNENFTREQALSWAVMGDLSSLRTSVYIGNAAAFYGL